MEYPFKVKLNSALCTALLCNEGALNHERPSGLYTVLELEGFGKSLKKCHVFLSFKKFNP